MMTMARKNTCYAGRRTRTHQAAARFPSPGIAWWSSIPAFLSYKSISRVCRAGKRKRNAGHESRQSPVDRLRDDASQSSNSRLNSPATSQSPFAAGTPPAGQNSSHDARVYNAVLTVHDGFTLATTVPKTSTTTVVTRIDVRNVPTTAMMAAASNASTTAAANQIRAELTRRLDSLPGPKISLVNTIDDTSPPLSFEFIRENILGEGVVAADPATRTGCSKCKAHMGQNMGCEYSKICECLEYAAVNDTVRMLPEERDRWEAIKAAGVGSYDTFGLPKKFPYYSSGPRTSAEKSGCLVPFYLHRRYPIYECNENCNCGPGCKTRVVQKGRQVRLEIFKTTDGRGWGLRCPEMLRAGQFIDTYRGEIITDAEASKRERKGAARGTKNSYLYSLDKFADALGLEQEDIYVIDGEFKGGPTRFMNHSCEPNCRQYVVSYNRHDPKVYEIAFFAIRDIAPNEELTFDYLDKDEEEDPAEVKPDARNEDGVKPVKCLCGARKCRKYLWL
ncbi:hypothetical protein MPH_03223 [Macrophomina phaseolina MS6]|uniref:SET domain-containing protein n=1 Tax=Macrophomina phaseolina (strain MS6) TaxID=1126212 RepID=K2SRP1_MACPH|nr:hypothetical protein MPH_03223 [Macrophomina phaseolina MS6]